MKSTTVEPPDSDMARDRIVMSLSRGCRYLEVSKMADKVGVVRPAGPVLNHNSTIFPSAVYPGLRPACEQLFDYNGM